jgi:hypothetical protein
LATAGLVEGVEEDEEDEPPELELDEELELLLLLPQAASAPRHRTSTGTANQFLQLSICPPPLDGDGGQDMADAPGMRRGLTAWQYK